jgi:hypothetical protein
MFIMFLPGVRKASCRGKATSCRARGTTEKGHFAAVPEYNMV